MELKIILIIGGFILIWWVIVTAIQKDRRIKNGFDRRIRAVPPIEHVFPIRDREGKWIYEDRRSSQRRART